MEVHYDKKDLKESPKKKGIYKNGKSYSFIDPKGIELSYEKEEYAKIAYERLYGEEG